MECIIELELTDTIPLSEWFGDDLVDGSRSSSAIPGAELELKSVETGVGFLDSTTTQVLMTFGGSVATNMIASALYDYIKAHIRRMQINGVAVRANPESIEAELKTLKQQQIDEVSGKDTETMHQK